jgi:hypothetical protein
MAMSDDGGGDDWLPKTTKTTRIIPRYMQQAGEEQIVESAAAMMEKVLRQIGMDCGSSASTKDTPTRFVKYLLEFFNPFSIDALIGNGFDNEGIDSASAHGMVVQTQIPFRMICEHHLLPAMAIFRTSGSLASPRWLDWLKRWGSRSLAYKRLCARRSQMPSTTTSDLEAQFRLSKPRIAVWAAVVLWLLILLLLLRWFAVCFVTFSLFALSSSSS